MPWFLLTRSRFDPVSDPVFCRKGGEKLRKQKKGPMWLLQVVGRGVVLQFVIYIISHFRNPPLKSSSQCFMERNMCFFFRGLILEESGCKHRS